MSKPTCAAWPTPSGYATTLNTAAAIRWSCRFADAADLVITGEGRADEQTLAGKAAMGVARHAGSAPVALLCGGLGPGAETVEESGAFALVQPIIDRPLGLESAMADTERLLATAAARLARGIGIGMGLSTGG